MNDNQKKSRFNIPDLKQLTSQVAEYVKKHQAGLGFFPTYDQDGDIIITFIYDESLFRAEEFIVKAVRVNEEGKLQFVYDLPQIIYSLESLAELEDNDWCDIDDENVYFEQTIFNIANGIESYENLK